jgi:hypothetical protein
VAGGSPRVAVPLPVAPTGAPCLRLLQHLARRRCRCRRCCCHGQPTAPCPADPLGPRLPPPVTQVGAPCCCCRRRRCCAVGQAYIISELTDLTELTDRRTSCTIVAGSTCELQPSSRCGRITFTDTMLAGVHFRPCASIFGTPSGGLGWTRGETLVDVYALETGLDHRHEATRLPAECRGTTQVS